MPKSKNFPQLNPDANSENFLSNHPSLDYDLFVKFVTKYQIEHGNTDPQTLLSVYEGFLHTLHTQPRTTDQLMKMRGVSNLEHTIGHQGEKSVTHWMSELVSNSIDAVGDAHDSVGRFGQGGMQIWGLLATRPDSSVVYSTKKKDATGFRVQMSQPEGKRMIHSGSNDKPSIGKERIGTTCQINMGRQSLTVDEQQEMYDYLVNKYAYSDVPVMIRNRTGAGADTKTKKLGNRGAGSSSEKKKEQKKHKVIIDIDAQTIRIRDQGGGMDAKTIATALLIPQSSEGKNTPQRDPSTTTVVPYDTNATSKTTEQSNNTEKTITQVTKDKNGTFSFPQSQADFVVGNTVISSLSFPSMTNAPRQGIRLPAGVSLTEDKKHIQLDEYVYECFNHLLVECQSLQDASAKKQRCEFLLRTLDTLAAHQNPRKTVAFQKINKNVGDILQSLRESGVTVFPHDEVIYESLSQNIKKNCLMLPASCIGIRNTYNLTNTLPQASKLDEAYEIERKEVSFFRYSFDPSSQAAERGYLYLKNSDHEVIAVIVDQNADLDNPQQRHIINTAVNLNIGYETPGEKVWYGMIGEKKQRAQKGQSGQREQKDQREESEKQEKYHFSEKMIDEMIASFDINNEQLLSWFDTRKKQLLTRSRDEQPSEDDLGVEMKFALWSGFGQGSQVDDATKRRYLTIIETLGSLQQRALIRATQVVQRQDDVDALIPHLLDIVLVDREDQISQMILDLPGHSYVVELAEMMTLRHDPEREQEYLALAYTYPHLWMMCEGGESIMQQSQLSILSMGGGLHKVLMKKKQSYMVCDIQCQSISDLQQGSDDTWAFVGRRAGKWKVYCLGGERKAEFVTEEFDYISDFQQGSDGTWSFVGRRAGKEELYCLGPGGKVEAMTGEAFDSISGLQQRSDGAWVFKVQKDGEWKVYCLRPGGKVEAMTEEFERIGSFQQGSDGESVFVGRRAGKEKLYCLGPGGKVEFVTEAFDNISHLQQGSDDTWAFVGRRAGKEELYLLGPGGKVEAVTEAFYYISGLQQGSDGAWVFSGKKDGKRNKYYLERDGSLLCLSDPIVMKNTLLPRLLASPETRLLMQKDIIEISGDDTFSFDLSRLLAKTMSEQVPEDRIGDALYDAMQDPHAQILSDILGGENALIALSSTPSSQADKNYSQFQNIIRTTTAGQGDIWLREWTQNALDAIRKSSHTTDDSAPQRSFFRDEDDHFVAEIHDDVGMNPDTVLHQLLPIGESGKRTTDVTTTAGQIGMFGVGFYSAFTDTCKEVRIETTKNRTTTTIVMTPQKHSALGIGRDDIDVQMHVTDTPHKPNGTTMQRVDTATGLNASILAVTAGDTLTSYTSGVGGGDIMLEVGDTTHHINNAEQVWRREGYTISQGHTPGWTHHGLYIGSLAPLMETRPACLRDMVERQCLIIDIPSRYVLNRSRNAVNDPQERAEIKAYIFGALSQYFVQQVFAGQEMIPHLPQDFFSLDFYYQKTFGFDEQVQKAKTLAETINTGGKLSVEDQAWLCEDANHLMYYLCYVKAFVGAETDKAGISLLDIQQKKNDKRFLDKRKKQLQGRFASWLAYDTARSESIQGGFDGKERTKLDDPNVQQASLLNFLDETFAAIVQQYRPGYILANAFYKPENWEIRTAHYGKDDEDKEVWMWWNIGHFSEHGGLRHWFDHQTNPDAMRDLIEVMTHELTHLVEGSDSTVTHNKGDGDTFESIQREMLAKMYQMEAVPLSSQ